MGNIIVLDELTACKIAAGEVIERPASVVKEMAENAIDAGASSVSVEIKAGGVKLIRVSDNGRGFEADDAVLAFEKHATSKIAHADDLEHISTLGFRGEALASIASVADVELVSRTAEAQESIYVHIKGGDVLETGVRGSGKGSVLTVRDLFYNTPARYKFLKKDSTEAGYVSEVLLRLALAHPEVSFRLVSDGSMVLHTPGNGDLLSTIYSLYGKGVSSSLLPVQYRVKDGLSVYGYVGVRDAIYGTRARQTFFVNGRHIRSKVLSSALDEAYKTVTMKGKFPFAVLCISIAPTLVDVNVHPAKTEVRFANDSTVFQCVFQGVSGALFGFAPQQQTQQSAVSSDQPVREVTPAPPARKPVSAAIPGRAEERQAIQQLLSVFDETVKKEKEIEAAPSSVPVKPAISPERSALEPSVPTPMEERRFPSTVAEASEELLTAKEQASPPLPAFVEMPEGSKPYRDHSVYTESSVIGQVFDTYIIMQQGDDMILLDQHAAHERILYEELRRSLSAGQPVSQMLLPPITLPLSPTEFLQLKQNSCFFQKLGFEIEEFGSQDMVVRAVPSVLAGGNVVAVILDGLERIQKGGGIALYTEESIHSMACKAAVKANKRMSLPEIQELLKRLSQLPNAETCPHGRPIVIRLAKRELEKKFKRVL